MSQGICQNCMSSKLLKLYAFRLPKYCRPSYHHYSIFTHVHATAVPVHAEFICCPIRQAMKKIGLKTPPSGTAETMEQAIEIAAQIGSYPLIIRPAFTLGGSGGGIAYNVEEFHQIIESGLQASVTNQACIFTNQSRI